MPALNVDAAVQVQDHGPVRVVMLCRPQRRNAVDLATAWALYQAFMAFDADASASVAVLTGAGGAFCAGADLQAVAADAEGEGGRLGVQASRHANDASMHPRVRVDGDFSPMGPARLRLGKPVIAAIEGPAVAGGLELALWCDLRVAAQGARLGVFCRRFGVPLIDGGTVRLPRLIGHARAMDLLLTGREVRADEALAIGLVNRVVPEGQALAEALALAQDLAALPQTCLRSDRLSALSQWDLDEDQALRQETQRGLAVIASGETAAGAQRFAGGAGRHGGRLEDPDAKAAQEDR